MKKRKNFNKRAQSELITLVLLILVSIAAVVIVSAFVINMVRDYLRPTDCFKTNGQLSINLENDYTYYNITSKFLYVSIARGEKEFNLTGISVVFGDGATSKKIKIVGGIVAGVKLYNGTDFTNNLVLPDAQETRYYSINTSSSNINAATISIAPSLLSGGDCTQTDSASVISKV